MGGIIFAYYVLATVVPIDKIIGRFYPIFGALLVFMSVGLIIGLAVSDHSFYSQGLDVATNFHPTDLPLWPLLFITIACGAVSGFHATQSPLMARCMQNEKSGRFIFYGAMIMLWAAAAYLIKRDKLHWVCTIPAMFMTAVTVTYLANAEIGFSLPMNISTMIGVGATLAATIAFLIGYKPNAQLIAEEK
ncbi:carbon starvation CstA family protein [Salinivibrio socompensis]|uniref:carbon starvation CstA family protein n=1 Tax=Salinivibrio socompensis TaxID=1510206 RepID=UPI0004B154DB